MKIEVLELGAFETNCYVLTPEEGGQVCVLIDPGLESEGLVAWLKERGLRPEWVLLTHGHVDHIAGVELVRERWPEVKVAIGRGDAGMLGDTGRNLSAMLGEPMAVRAADREVEGGEELETVAGRLKVLSTPGHTPGGVSFYCEEAGVVFSGDSLFAGSIGRDDFPGGDRAVLLEGIREALFTLAGETRVYPGHGPATTVAREKQSNPFFV